MTPLKKTIRSRFTFLEHVIRLPEGTPVRKLLGQCFKPCNKKRGRPEMPELRAFQVNLKNINILLDIGNPESPLQRQRLASDSCKWKRLLMQ